MERLVERMSGARRFDAYRRADTRFHIALAEAARSPRLVAEMTDIQGQMSELIALIPHPERVLTRSNAQHARLVQALGRRDAARSVRLIRQHLAGTEHILAGLMPAEPPEAPPLLDQPRSNMRVRS
jgi:DNA-binding GntR family transcriptional regulator